jgi:hypothetical protein
MKIGWPSMEVILHVHMHLDLPLADQKDDLVGKFRQYKCISFRHV